jgi:alpha-amylase/alpha-mannosidase (GH57 family)
MKLVFIWHMHQPFYKDLKTGEYLMPWVRLHGSKDYLDMLLLLDEFPRIKQTFNLVPSLLEQLIDYADQGAADRRLTLSRKAAATLSDEEKTEIADSFFAAHYPTMIKPYPRYNEIYFRCHDKSGRGIHGLTDQDFLDLQVWSNAVWIDPSLRLDKRVKALYRKGRDYTEEDKNNLLDYQKEILRRVIPTYRERANAGKIEISFSPYYHPILPLLVDTDAARMAVPGISLPHRRFSHPEDAEEQVRSAVELYRELFGTECRGMWPSEGSVSEQILPILHRHGIRWIASDEEIYYASINHPIARQRNPNIPSDGIHHPYAITQEDFQIGMLFRDHRLSDKIGFVYSNWDAEKAADDFMAELYKLSATYEKTGTDPLVSIILDGENAWEYYPNDGIDFLRALYGRLDLAKGIETVLPSEVFGKAEPVKKLPFLFSGSWISHDFRVWIGHSEDNAAWDLLGATRDQLVEFLKEHPEFDQGKATQAWKEIYIAEGSDWCWWYGDDHQTEFFEMFDYLFRKHLQNVWEIIGATPPALLLQPIRKQTKQIGLLEPTDFISPIIDGRQTNFFEWFGAGRVECHKLGGAMHRADARIREILFGYDDEHVYFRVDFEKDAVLDKEKTELSFELVCEEKHLLVVTQSGAELRLMTTKGYEKIPMNLESSWVKVAEVGIPRDASRCEREKRLYFAVTLKENEKVVERWPEANYISIDLPNRGETFFWQV